MAQQATTSNNNKKSSALPKKSHSIMSFFAGVLMCCAIICCGWTLGFISIFPQEISTTGSSMNKSGSEMSVETKQCGDDDQGGDKVQRSHEFLEQKETKKTDGIYQEQQKDWRWSPSGSCRKGTTAYGNLRIKPTQQEYSRKKLSDIHLKQAIETFRSCGVVAIEPGFQNNHLDMVHRLNESLYEILTPLLTSRTRIRSKLREAMLSHSSLRSLWNDPNVSNELLFKQ